MQQSLKPTDLWQFSLQYYGESAHSKALLHIQNNFAGNVNLCLLLIYLEQYKLALSEEALLLLHNEVTHFNHAYTSPLRALRAKFKQDLSNLENYHALRQSMLKAELDLEKQEQSILVSCFNSSHNSQNTIGDPLQSYLTSLLAMTKTDLDQVLKQLR